MSVGLAKRHDQRGKREQPIKQLTLPWSIKEYPLNLFSTSSPNPSKSTLIKLPSELNGITFFCSRHNLSSLSLSSEINKIKRDQVIIVNRGEMENTLIVEITGIKVTAMVDVCVSLQRNRPSIETNLINSARCDLSGDSEWRTQSRGAIFAEDLTVLLPLPRWRVLILLNCSHSRTSSSLKRSFALINLSLERWRSGGARGGR